MIKIYLTEKKLKILFLIEADDFDLNQYDMQNTIIIYLGHHGDRIAPIADLVLPTTAFTEKNLYI